MYKLLKGLMMILVSLSLVACSDNSYTSNENTVINVYTRDSSSGTREAFESTIGLEDGQLTKYASEVSSNGDMATKVGADVNAIGYASLTTDFNSNNIKPLNYEGVKASIETVLDGSYKMQRPFNYVTRQSGDFINEDMEQLVNAFIDFITKSQEGLAVIEEAGGIVDYTNAKAWEEIAVNYPVLSKDNSSLVIRTGGSTSVEKTIKAALEAFQPLAGNVGFAMNQTGSSDGQKRTLGEEKDGANAIEIGFTSRNFKESEDISKAMASGSYCLDAVVVIVNNQNMIENIKASDIADIYRGTITSFSDIK